MDANEKDEKDDDDGDDDDNDEKDDEDGALLCKSNLAAASRRLSSTGKQFCSCCCKNVSDYNYSQPKASELQLLVESED